MIFLFNFGSNTCCPSNTDILDAKVPQKKIQKNSHSFWLNWKIKTILDRISKNKNRPIALNLNNKDLADLYKKRVKFYKLSDFRVNCEKKNKNEIIKIILEILKNENS